MAHEPPEPGGNPKALRPHYLPRPGHADLVGAFKYDRRDVRDILERASARETAARVACAAVAKRLLAEFGVRIGSHIVSIGSVEAEADELPEDVNSEADKNAVRCLDDDAATRMMVEIDEAKERGDTLGGIFEVVATGLPVGLGSYVSWDTKLDGRLAGAVMSIQAVKGVEVGLGFTVKVEAILASISSCSCVFTFGLNTGLLLGSSSSSFTSTVSSGVSDFSSSSEPKIKPSNELPSVDSSLAGSVSGTVSSTAGSGSSVSSVSATMGTTSVSVISSESSSFSSISELSCSARSSSIFSSFASIS